MKVQELQQKDNKRRSSFKWYYIPAACVVFGLCVAITPIRDTAFAKALKINCRNWRASWKKQKKILM